MGFIFVPRMDYVSGSVGDALVAVDSISCVCEYPNQPGCTIYLKNSLQQYIYTSFTLQQVRERIVNAMAMYSK